MTIHPANHKLSVPSSVSFVRSTNSELQCHQFCDSSSLQGRQRERKNLSSSPSSLFRKMEKQNANVYVVSWVSHVRIVLSSCERLCLVTVMVRGSEKENERHSSARTRKLMSTKRSRRQTGRLQTRDNLR